MSKITLSNVGSIQQNPTTAQTEINSNFAVIQTAMDNTLSRDGTSPNVMGNNLDMNSNHILNLPAPVSNYDPIRLMDVSTINAGGITVSPLPTGGLASQALTKNSSTNFDTSWTYVVPVGGNTGQVLSKNSSTNFDIGWASSLAFPGGSNTQLQYNNGGIFSGVTGATTNGTILTLTSPVLVTAALGSPASVGTMPAFTLGGVVSGGGNQINNVIIGNSTPLVGAFTTVFATTLSTTSTLTINAFTLGGTISGGGNQLNNIIIGNVTPLAGAFTNLTATGTSVMGTNASLPGGGATVAAINGNAGTTINGMTGFGPQLVVAGPDGNRGAVALQSYMQSTAGNESSYLAFTSRGTMASPASIQAGDFVGEFFAHGSTTTGGFQFLHNAGAGFVMAATDNFTSSTAGEQINVYTTPTGTGTAALNSVFNAPGGLTISSGEPLLFLNKNAAASPPGIPIAFGSNASFRLIEADNISPIFAVQSFSTGFNAPTFITLAARGTGAVPTPTQSGDFLAEHFAYGYASASAPGYVTSAGAGYIVTATNNYTTTVAGARLDFTATPTGSATGTTSVSVGASLMVGTTTDGSAGQIIMNNASFLMRNKTTWTNGAAAAAGTLSNAPAAGNPTKWIPIDDNGTTRFIPAW